MCIYSLIDITGIKISKSPLSRFPIASPKAGRALPANAKNLHRRIIVRAARARRRRKLASLSRRGGMGNGWNGDVSKLPG